MNDREFMKVMLQSPLVQRLSTPKVKQLIEQLIKELAS